MHGGEKFTASAVINDEVLQGIKDSVPFAPLHNPAHLIGIAEALKSFPNLADKNVAVFDTAFHQTMPEESTCTPCRTACTATTAFAATAHTAPATST